MCLAIWARYLHCLNYIRRQRATGALQRHDQKSPIGHEHSQDEQHNIEPNRATFYAHFVDKYALVDELIREGFTQMLQQRMATPALSTDEHLRRLLLAVCDLWGEGAA